MGMYEFMTHENEPLWLQIVTAIVYLSLFATIMFLVGYCLLLFTGELTVPIM